jgi:hypothetical protein
MRETLSLAGCRQRGRMYRVPDDYPLSVSEVLARPVTFKAATLKVMRRFERTKP